MGELLSKPSEFKAGSNSISARALNKIVTATPRLIKGGDGNNVVRVGDKYLIQRKKDIGRTPSNVSIATISEIRDKYLVCEKDGATIIVAKPYVLRSGVVFPFGYSYVYDSSNNYNKRVASNGTDTETQYITPGYEVDEEILAVRVPASRIVDANGNSIVWIDLNIAGRFWAMKEE